ncbi:DUF4861 domain-containing protein [Aridibaculum aurantiacum]|uniref:DUF4861 domain-containing protein n=1 Tax=Aridibaculum aurantiacum TaxID=2810307 RepID=UPI001A958E3D|nr:DUF4861 domain-containing protein [Aridibaculum aurantiacum]
MLKAFSIGLITTVTLLIGCTGSRINSSQQVQRIVVSNSSSIALVDKPVAVNRASLRNVSAGQFPLLLSAAKDTIPVQLDDVDGDNQWDELFFVANLPANSSTTFTLQWTGVQPVYKPRTSVRFGKRMKATEPVQPASSEVVHRRDLPKSIGFQRYQTDGPTWENDKVGFRHYLDGRNAKDVFGKLVPEISPEDVGINAKGEVEDNYHVMEKWGRDILAVGNSVGIGGVALVQGDQLFRLGVTVDDSVNNVAQTHFNILTEGPVRSMMKFRYEHWTPAAGRHYDLQETVSITPGMYAYKNTVVVSNLEGGEELGIGIVKINTGKDPLVVPVGNDWVALVSHDKHSYNKEWWLGLALIVPAKAYNGFIRAPKTGKLSNTFLAKLKVTNGAPVTYYSVAGWELSDAGFKEEAYFKNYVVQLAQQLAAEIKVSVK